MGVLYVSYWAAFELKQKLPIFLTRKKDPCYLYSDRYLLATALIYFHRARLEIREFTPENFFALLHLANDMEEDFEYQVRFSKFKNRKSIMSHN